MSATLTITWHKPQGWETIDLPYEDTCAAGEGLARIVADIEGHIETVPVPQGRRGHILLDKPTTAPLRITQVLGDYTITED